MTHDGCPLLLASVTQDGCQLLRVSIIHDGFDGMEPSRVAHFAKLEKITFPEQSSHYDLAPCTLRVYDFAFKGWVIFF